MKKRIVCIVLGLVMMLSQTFTVLAKTENELKQEKSQAESRLNETNAAISSLSEKQTKIQAEINVMDSEMVELMVQIDATRTDIALTENGIVEKEEDIVEKQGEITETEADLKVAEEDRDKQYEDMKKRIQYIYEHGGNEAWLNMLTGAENVSTLLNRAEYAQSMHEYDRDQLTQYMEVVEQVRTLKENLENQKAELENQKAELEGQRVSLESQKADLEVQQSDLKVQMDAKKATCSDYEAQIATAQRQASEISSLIAQQDAQLQRLAEERRQAEEAEARRRAAAEEEARRRAAEEEQRRQEEASRPQQNQSSNNSASSNNGNTSNNTNTSGNTQTGNSNTGSSNAGSGSGSSQKEETPGYSSGVSGSSIVAYADRFVGNPYVWGGNSLTNGIDCSHFVYQVLKNTGAYSGGYTTSAGWRSLGRPVGSLSEAKAGDVICYSGHVAIYDGYGGIVEAKGSKWGITHDRSASHATILAIRRFT